MQKYFLLHKPLGLTPQQAINHYRSATPKYHSVKLGSAGRLDPMAEGLLVIMVGDENKNQPHYIGLDKTYEIELLMGVSTDSYDLLGLPTKLLAVEYVEESLLQTILMSKVGKILQAYPPYSAVRVNSKPLYWWARQGRLAEVVIPVAERTVYKIEMQGMQTIPKCEFGLELIQRINTIDGDFRQAETLSAWKAVLDSSSINYLKCVKLRVDCSSGTFMRGLVNQIGQDLGCGAVTRSIVRTRIGNWELKDAERLELLK